MTLLPRQEGVAASGGGLALLMFAVAAGVALQCAHLAGNAVATPQSGALMADRTRASWPARRQLSDAVPAARPPAETARHASVEGAARELPAADRGRGGSRGRSSEPSHATRPGGAPASASLAPASTKGIDPRQARSARATAQAQKPSASEAPTGIESRRGAVTAMGAPMVSGGPFPSAEDIRETRRMGSDGSGGAPEPDFHDFQDDTTADPDSGGTQVVVLGPARARPGDQITFHVNLEGAAGVAHAPLRVDFDPAVLRFDGGQEGTLFSSDGAATQFLAAPGGTGGRIQIALSRMPPARGVNGGGALCALTFTAIGAGASPIIVSGGRLMDSSGRAVSFRRNDAYISIE